MKLCTRMFDAQMLEVLDLELRLLWWSSADSLGSAMKKSLVRARAYVDLGCSVDVIVRLLEFA